MEDATKWIDESYAREDSGSILVFCRSGNCKWEVRSSRAVYRQYIEEGVSLLRKMDLEDQGRVIDIREAG